ncbi:MAG: ABC transporter substrate-binding protein [Caldilineaceae bacterium]|nr:ABC transporter substrate-binding protein [Caldilineaceae bacterium]
MIRRRSTILLALLLALALMLAACPAPVAPTTGTADSGAAPAPQPAADPLANTLIVAIAEDTASYDPQRAYETLPSIVHKVTYQTLITFPADSVEQVIPSLAESWEISEDGTVYTFSLDPNALFSDGSPVTADDVVFSFNRLANVTGNPSFLANGIVSVEAADEQTVVLTLEQPDPAILAKMVFGGFSVVNQAVVEAQGGSAAEDASTADTAETWLNQNSAGSGPYVLERWEPGVETVLVRNDNYWGDAPAIERVIFRNIPESATQKIQLEAGDIDIAFDLSQDQLPSLEGNPNVTIYQGLSDTLVFLKGNQNPEVGGPMSDPLVQAAVRYALDYEGIRLLAGGESVTPASMLPVGFLGAYEANSGIQRDLDRARELLAEAGYADGVTIDLAYPDFTFAGVNFGTFAQKVQADLAEAGINAALAPAEVQVALQAYRSGTEPFGLWLWLPDYRDSLDYVEFLPAGVVGTRTGWVDETADAEILALRDALRVETDDDVREGMFQEMQDYLMEQGPYAPILQPGLQIGLSSRVQGFIYNPQWRVDVSLISKQ